MTVPSCTGFFCLRSGSEDIKRKIWLACSSRPAFLPPSTPPLDSAAHHIATRQIRASCSISTVPTLVKSAIMGAEKDGFPAVPLRTAQTLNSTVVWAVSEAPNISRRFTSTAGWFEAHYTRPPRCSTWQQFGLNKQTSGPKGLGWAGLGWAGLGDMHQLCAVVAER